MRLLPKNRNERWRFLGLLGLFAVLAFLYHEPALAFLTRTPVLYHYALYQPKEGDVVFQSLPHTDLIDAIEGITHSPYSHCGVVLRNEKGEWVVIESIFTVHETPLFMWMARGRGAAFAAYRLDPKFDSSLPEFKKDLLAHLGEPYDFDYNMTKPKTAYCSGLVYQSFEKATGEKLGRLEKLRDLDWKPFEPFIREIQDGRLPLDRVMITPAALSQAPQLHEVHPHGA